MAINKSEIALIQAIGRRMADARMLCGYTQTKAAHLLGIKPIMLGKLEAGVNVKYVPLSLVHRAARLYDISLDFIFGESEDWELAPEVQAERSFGVGIHAWHQQQLSSLAFKFSAQHRKQQVLVKAVKLFTHAADEVQEAMTQFKGVNDFDSFLCSSKLNHRINKLDKASAKARLELVRCGAISLNFLPDEAINE